MTRFASWLAGRALQVLPDPLLGALLPGSLGFRTTDIPGPPQAPDAGTRLYVAPVNWAGQGWQWAHSAEKHLDDVGAIAMAYSFAGGFEHRVDQRVPVGAYVGSRRWQRAQRTAVVNGFSHVLIEAERHPFGAVFTSTLESQVDDLVDRGLSVAMVCHGSDIRLPSRHSSANENSPFRPGAWAETPKLERSARANRMLLDALRLPVFVSTPDLLLDVPYAEWLPVVVDPGAWATGDPPLQRTVPVVVHAPSKGIIKGSDLIDPILQRLDREGLVAYRRVDGVPAQDMPALVGAADIVLDQFRIGGYGVAACEAMAAGRVVVSHVNEFTRHHVRESTGFDLPIIQSTAAEIERTLRGILANRAEFQKRAADGVEFVRAVHDGGRSAAVLRPFLAPRTR